MKRAEIDKILNELFFEFNDKATALLDARKVFVNFDPEVQFEQIAKTINLSISADESLLDIDEKNFDKAIDELTTNLNMNKGYYIRINEHLEIQLAKTAITIYVKFSEIASGKLNKLYGR